MESKAVQFVMRPFARWCRVCHTMKHTTQFRQSQANHPWQKPRCKACDANAQRARRSTNETFVSNRP